MLPPECPTTWADPTPRASNTRAASSAIETTESDSFVSGERPEPRLSKAIRR
jgi:hypothetical protein